MLKSDQLADILLAIQGSEQDHIIVLVESRGPILNDANRYLSLYRWFAHEDLSLIDIEC